MGVDDLAGTPDQNLVRALDRDPAAVEEFYRRHVRPLTAYLTRSVGDPHDAADLVAATFLAAMESCRRFDPQRGNARQWLYGIAGNLASARWRRAGAETRALARLGGQRTQPADEYDRVDGRIDAAELTRAAFAALPSLPEAERELVQRLMDDD